MTIAYDRTPESTIYEVVRRTEKKWSGLNITDYTATESFHLEELLGMSSDVCAHHEDSRRQMKEASVICRFFSPSKINNPANGTFVLGSDYSSR